MKATSTFVLREEKKHSVRYDSAGEVDAAGNVDSVATSIYVSKSVLKRPYPTRIRLTVESD